MWFEKIFKGQTQKHSMSNLEVRIKFCTDCDSQVLFPHMKSQYFWTVLKVPKTKRISSPYVADMQFGLGDLLCFWEKIFDFLQGARYTGP